MIKTGNLTCQWVEGKMRGILVNPFTLAQHHSLVGKLHDYPR
jgi:hypothetical protein